MKKTKKGFIQIPLLIIIVVSVLTTSVSVGVLYKKGKLPFITKKDNVVQPVPSSSPISTQEPQSEVLEPSELKNKTEKILIPTQKSNPSVFTPGVEQPNPLQAPSFINSTQPQTYSIVSFPVDTSSYSEGERAVWINAYNEFLQTPNLKYMDHSQQDQYLAQIVEKYYGRYKYELETEIQQRKENLIRLQEEEAAYEQQEQLNWEIEAKLEELRQALQYEEGRAVAMNVIQGRKQRAYQDWVSNNQGIYAQILNSNYYANQLNSILAAYGL